MRFGRQDELEADRLGVRLGSEAGYDPRSMIELMKILEQSSQGNRPPEFFSTHPNPENRIQKIQQAIQEQYPNGVPEGLEP
jgi:predicted Zn-dependent protease